ncbi:unnamed protein product [Sphagnum compactum]
MNPDIQAHPGPADTVSEISSCPRADYFAVSSWDNQVCDLILFKVRVYQLANGQPTPVTSMTHEQPVLSVSWSSDGMKLFSGGADKMLRVMDMNTGQTANIQAHDQTIRTVRWDYQNNTIVTGSWDKTIKYWDLRQAQPAATVALPERVYAMDTIGQWLVIGTAERHVVLVRLTSPTTIYKTIVSPLKWQTRSIACLSDASGYCVGSIEGRVGIQYFEDKKSSENFAFRCHRTGSNAFPVNVLAVHPTYGSLGTGGADGSYCVWDKDSKSRLFMVSDLGSPITGLCFSRHSDVALYSLGYDWSKGYENYLPSAKPGVYVRKLTKAEIEPKGHRRR